MRTGRVHEVELHEVINAELFGLRYDGAEITAEVLGISLLLYLRLVRFLRIQAEAPAGTRAPGASGALLRARLSDRRHQQRLDVDARVVHLLHLETRNDSSVQRTLISK